jgi:hypothetical protein
MLSADITDTIMTVAAAGALTSALKLFSDYRKSREARKLVLDAETQAYKTAPEAIVQKTEALHNSQASLEQRVEEVNKLIESSQAALQVGNLFDLYSKQIDKYQTETQARAGWSFIFAIFSMVSGLAFVAWGGAHILMNPGWEHVAAGTGISAIGGSIGAFITKTFLDVHRLSLSQLNHYFQQPVLNSYILTAQRVVECIDEKTAKRKAYESILASVLTLVGRGDDSSSVWLSTAEPKAEGTERAKTARKTQKTRSSTNSSPTP